MGRYERMGLHVKRLEGGKWAVFDGAFRASDPVCDERVAVAALDRLQRARIAQERPCLCCGTTFESEGMHNRLCDACRRGGSLGKDWW